MDTRPVFTHRLPLSEAAKGYDIFGGQKDDCIKVMMKTPFGVELDQRRGKTVSMGKVHLATSS